MTCAWLVGSNYVPKSAINQLEMWQEASFDPSQIETEFAWAEAMGMNTMRIFLHDLLWQQDAAGFQKRIDSFLAIAARHHIRPMLVLFAGSYPKEELKVKDKIARVTALLQQPFRSRSASGRSIGDSSRVKRRRIFPGNRGNILTFSTSRRCGFTSCCVPTECRIDGRK